MVLFKDQDEKTNILKGRKRKHARRKAAVGEAKRPYWKSSNGEVVDKESQPDEVASPSSFQETAKTSRRQITEDFVRSESLSKRKTKIQVDRLDFPPVAGADDDGNKKIAACPSSMRNKNKSPTESPTTPTSNRTPPSPPRACSRARDLSDPAIETTGSTDSIKETDVSETDILKGRLVEKDSQILKIQKRHDDEYAKVVEGLAAVRKLLGKPADCQACDDNNSSNWEIIQQEFRSLHADLSKAKDESTSERKLASEKIANADAAIGVLTKEKISLADNALLLQKRIDNIKEKQNEEATMHERTKKKRDDAIQLSANQARQLASQQSELAGARRTITTLQDSEKKLFLMMRQSEDNFNASISEKTNVIAQQKDLIVQLKEQIALLGIEKEAGENALQTKSKSLEQAHLELGRYKADLLDVQLKTERERCLLNDQIKRMDSDIDFWKTKCDQEMKTAQEDVGRLTSSLSEVTKEKDRLAEMVNQLGLQASRLSSERDIETAAMETVASEYQNQLKNAHEDTIRMQADLSKAHNELENQKKAHIILEAEVLRLKDREERTNAEIESWRTSAQSTLYEIEQLEARSKQVIVKHMGEVEDIRQKLADVNEELQSVQNALRAQEETLTACRRSEQDLLVKFQQGERLVAKLVGFAKQKDLALVSANENNLELEEQNLRLKVETAHLQNQLDQVNVEKATLERRCNELLSTTVPRSPEPSCVNLEQNINTIVEAAATVVRFAKADLDYHKKSHGADGVKSKLRRRRKRRASTTAKPSMYGHLAGGGSAKEGTVLKDDAPSTGEPKITYIKGKIQCRLNGKEAITIHSYSDDDSS